MGERREVEAEIFSGGEGEGERRAFSLRAQYRNLGIPGGKIPSAVMSRMWLDE